MLNLRRQLPRGTNGFTLVEMAIVMILLGVALIAIISAFLHTQQRLKKIRTEENMEIVMDALSGFALRNYRVPCPATAAGGAEPFGAELGSSATGAAIGACQGAGEGEGIIPYITLGLREEDIRDGWGNFITYQVSPAFTRDPELTATPVHALCRTKAWIEGVVYDDGLNQYKGGRNVKALKARFCCSGQDVGAADEDVQICGSALVAPCEGSRIWPFDRDSQAARYADVNEVADHYDAGDAVAFGNSRSYYDAQVYTSMNATTAVYALISHGENEIGAFLRGGGRIADGGGTFENLNADNGQRMVWAIPSDKSTALGYFDDIVRWQTQPQILARLGGGTCAIP